MFDLRFEIYPVIDGVRLPMFYIEAPKSWSTQMLDALALMHHQQTTQLQARITELQKKQKRWYQREHS